MPVRTFVAVGRETSGDLRFAVGRETSGDLRLCLWRIASEDFWVPLVVRPVGT